MKYCLIFTPFDDEDAMNILEISRSEYRSAVMAKELSYGLCSEYRISGRFQWHNFFDLVAYRLHSSTELNNLLSALEVSIEEVMDIFALHLEYTHLNEENDVAIEFARRLSSELDLPTIGDSEAQISVRIAYCLFECSLRIHQKIVAILSTESDRAPDWTPCPD